MILTLLLWKVKGCHYFIEAVLTIVSKTKHDVITIVSKDTFSNHREEKKNVFPIILFYFYSRQVIEGLSRIYLGKKFLFTNIIDVPFLHVNLTCIIELHNKQNKRKRKMSLKSVRYIIN